MQTVQNKRAKFARGLVMLMLGSAMLLPVTGAQGAEAVVQTSGNISYVSGGVGENALAKLESLAKDFNVKLVFALQSGNYVTDVQVAIADARGKTLLDTRSAGPWFLARLPAGSYQVTATFEGKAVKRQVTVGKTKLQTVDFRWAAE